MAEVGDRVEVKSKSGSRLGVVIGVNGRLLRLRWENEEETTIVPGPGVLSIIAGTPTRAARTRGSVAGAGKSVRRKTTSSPSAAAKQSSPAKKPTAVREAAVKKIVGKATPPVEKSTRSIKARDSATKRPKDAKTSDRKGSSSSKSKGKKDKGGKKKR